jgi:CRISPR-associated endonuclease/helicase Cas3
MDLKEALEKAYAKSTGETIREHTDKLLERLKKIKEIRGERILSLCPEEWKEIFWDIAEIIIEYHDYGKLHSPFQKKMIESGKLSGLPYELKNVTEVPHNFLSPCFLPENILKKYSSEILTVINQAIAYHHDKDVDERMYKLILEVAEQDLSRFKTPLFLKYWQYINPQKYINPKDDSVFKIFVLLKGLLHRLDYTASGDLEVELPSDEVFDKIRKRLESKGKKLNEMQNFVLSNSDKNLLIIAPTGSGKTEAGALYINKDKGFFVLPLRVSIDSIYDRFTGTNAKDGKSGYGLNHVGLMHSTSLFKHLEKINEKNSDLENSRDFDLIYMAEQESKNLSYPLNITTPDQLFPFVFKYPGYERIYATLGYSKIVVDEIQMYNPMMLAYMLKGLQAIKELGGKIMIMTATFPEFLMKELSELKINFGEREIFKMSDVRVRHNVRVEKEKDLLDEEIIKEIVKEGNEKKVLVICNTVNKAVKVYENLPLENKFLLHSRFIQKHRKLLENKIQSFAPNDVSRANTNPGVWVTTQIAEVSLDIDFDVLYTELSSIDSLIQRMGRVNRSGRHKLNPNVIVCCKKKTDDKHGCSGIGNIYDERIFDSTKEILQNGDLPENKKMELVESVYNYEKIEKTIYHDNFKESLKLIKEIWEVGKIYNPIESLRKAQNQFREIFTITIIPKEIYNKEFDLFEQIKHRITSRDLEERVIARKELLEFTVDIPRWYIQKMRIKPHHFVNNIYIVPLKYSFDEVEEKGKGSSIELDESNLCD